MFEHALDIIPKEDVQDTPIFLLATAGVRMLPKRQRDFLLNEVCNYARSTTKFQLPDCDLHIQVITGETEGLYGWVAANYLLGGFDNPKQHAHGDGHHTYGFLDLGGASAQIAFAPNATVAEKHADDLQILRLRSIDGNAAEFRVFVTTWLSYGVNEARKKYLGALSTSIDSSQRKEIPDPCLPVGLKSDGDDLELPAPLVGTGKFGECLKRTLPLLGKEEKCEDPPCLFHGKHVPEIDFDINHFVGVSEYWHTTHEIFAMGHTDSAYDYETYQTRVKEFCSQDWETIEKGLKSQKWGDKVDVDRASEVCFKASWLVTLLHEGIGVPRKGIAKHGVMEIGHNQTSKHPSEAVKPEDYLEPFQAVNKIDSTEVSWTLGKMVLYASSQIPPLDEDKLPVGFGTNVAKPGEEVHFEEAGGQPDLPPPPFPSAPALPDDTDTDTDADTDDEGGSWHSNLLNTSHLPRRTPGILMFLLIVVLAGLLLCGRERRANLFRKITRTFKRRSNSSPTGSPRYRRGPGASRLTSKLPFGLGGSGKDARGKYESVMEEGDMPHPGDFELGAMSSGSSDGGSIDNDSMRNAAGAAGRSDRRHHRGGGQRPGSGSNIPYSDNPPGVGGAPSRAQAAGGGLTVRTSTAGSRERLSSDSGVGTGHISRNASPSRLRTPLTPTYKENLD